MNSVYYDVLLGFFLNEFSLLTSTLFLKWEFLICLYKFYRHVPKHRDFLIFLFQCTEMQNSLYIETQRFCNPKLFIFSNLFVSIHWGSKIFVHKTQKFLNLCVSIHGDSKTSMFYTRRFFLKANSSVKSQQMMKIF